MKSGCTDDAAGRGREAQTLSQRNIRFTFEVDDSLSVLEREESSYVARSQTRCITR